MKIGLSNPFNYTGSKHRYLKDMMEILPEESMLTVCDPFCGGGDLCSNLDDTWRVSASDSMPQLIEMHNSIKHGGINVRNVAAIAYINQLNKLDESAYIKFRAEYNKCKSPLDLYILICHSNSNRIRFNASGDFNMPFGKRWFNDSMQEKLDQYRDRLTIKPIAFECKKYEDVNFAEFDLTLIDPPYLNTAATYNERGGWGVDDEINLHKKIKSECKKFVYFGQVWSKGVHNELLDEFSTGYNVKILKDTTKHCSSNRNDKDKTVEVMIWS